jgi:hypothetical protein
MFAGAGVLTVAAAVALWQSIDAYRWRDWRRFWIATVLVPLLSTVVYASIWEGSRHPTFNFWGNLWLGPDWICENPGRVGGTFCTRGAGPPLSENDIPQ